MSDWKNETCGTCAYGDVRDELNGSLACRRFPPNINKLVASKASETSFPIVHPEFAACAEHKHTEEK